MLIFRRTVRIGQGFRLYRGILKRVYGILTQNGTFCGYNSVLVLPNFVFRVNLRGHFGHIEFFLSSILVYHYSQWPTLYSLSLLDFQTTEKRKLRTALCLRTGFLY